MEWQCTAQEAGERLDKFVCDRTEELTRSGAQRLLEQGEILVNGGVQNKNYRLREGDQVEVHLPEPVPLAVEPQNIPIEIVYEDEELLVVNKPQGMVVHPAAGNPDGTLVNALLYHCQGRLSSINGVIRPGIVHRIDKDTSGLLMVAKTDRAHLELSRQIQEHSFKREYEAILLGRLKQQEGRVDAPIGRHRTERKKMCVTPQGKEATTHFWLLQQFAPEKGWYSHVRCRLETGRTHQIRVHMAFLGHPVAGDPVYGPKKDKTGEKGQLLHAKTLGFVHPLTGEYLEFTSELPAHMRNFILRNGGLLKGEQDEKI
ncbi:MAG: RluA family pseudouridine synthase [Eubacteriales bacterium]|jgi:23S rRNA pseudouridine1911/1915/1917 synthase